MLGGCGKPQFADLPGTRSMAGQACTAELRGLLLVAPVHVSFYVLTGKVNVVDTTGYSTLATSLICLVVK